MCGSVAICWLLLLAQRTQASPHPIGYHLHKLPLGPLLYLRDYLDDTNGLQPMMTIRAHCLQTAPETQTHPDMASVQSTMLYAYGQHSVHIESVAPCQSALLPLCVCRGNCIFCSDARHTVA